MQTLAASQTVARTHTAAPKGTFARSPSGVTPPWTAAGVLPAAWHLSEPHWDPPAAVYRGALRSAYGEHDPACYCCDVADCLRCGPSRSAIFRRLMFIRSSDTRRELAAGAQAMSDACTLPA